MGDTTSRSDAELFRVALSEPEAFGQFYGRHEHRLLSFFARACESLELAADLTAETFATALESLDRYDPERGEPGAWLYGIARHVLAASLDRGRVEDRARVRLGMVPLVFDEDAYERVEALLSLDGAAGAALEALPGELREAVAGRVLDDRAYAEIAGSLACSESLVRQRVSRGLARMRAQLQRGDAP